MLICVCNITIRSFWPPVLTPFHPLSYQFNQNILTPNYKCLLLKQTLRKLLFLIWGVMLKMPQFWPQNPKIIKQTFFTSSQINCICFAKKRICKFIFILQKLEKNRKINLFIILPWFEFPVYSFRRPWIHRYRLNY